MKTERESTDFGNYSYLRVQCILMVIPITTDFTVAALLVDGKQLLAASMEVSGVPFYVPQCVRKD